MTVYKIGKATYANFNIKRTDSSNSERIEEKNSEEVYYGSDLEQGEYTESEEICAEWNAYNNDNYIEESNSDEYSDFWRATQQQESQ